MYTDRLHVHGQIKGLYKKKRRCTGRQQMYTGTIQESKRTRDNACSNARRHFRQEHIDTQGSVSRTNARAMRGCHYTQKEDFSDFHRSHFSWPVISFPPISLSQGEIVKLSLLYSLPLSVYPSNKSIIGERIFIKLHNPNEIAASMMWQRVFGLIFLKVSKECAASFFRILTKGKLSHIRRSQSSNSAPWYKKLLLTKHEIFWKLLKDLMFYKIGR
jgi:hypothetical protein